MHAPAANPLLLAVCPHPPPPPLLPFPFLSCPALHLRPHTPEKYPVEDEYSKFISEHGGHTNAYTAAEDTNYQFDVGGVGGRERIEKG